MMNKYEDAISKYMKVLEIDQFNAPCHFNLASAYNDLCSYSRAAFHYKLSLQIDKNNANTYFNLIGVLENMKEFKEADKYYERAKELFPDHERVLEREGIKKRAAKKAKKV